jgi:hypothetical protein
MHVVETPPLEVTRYTALLAVEILFTINPLTPEFNLSAQRCLLRFLLGILIFKGLTARRLYKSFGVKGLNDVCTDVEQTRTE